MIDYKKYVGQYVKRFYSNCDSVSMYKIKDYRDHEFLDPLYNKLVVVPEFLYGDGKYDDFWTDVEDSVIITNEMPIIEDECLINVNDPDYTGFNPFIQDEKKV